MAKTIREKYDAHERIFDFDVEYRYNEETHKIELRATGEVGTAWIESAHNRAKLEDLPTYAQHEEYPDLLNAVIKKLAQDLKDTVFGPESEDN